MNEKESALQFLKNGAFGSKKRKIGIFLWLLFIILSSLYFYSPKNIEYGHNSTKQVKATKNFFDLACYITFDTNETVMVKDFQACQYDIVDWFVENKTSCKKNILGNSQCYNVDLRYIGFVYKSVV